MLDFAFIGSDPAQRRPLAALPGLRRGHHRRREPLRRPGHGHRHAERRAALAICRTASRCSRRALCPAVRSGAVTIAAVVLDRSPSLRRQKGGMTASCRRPAGKATGADRSAGCASGTAIRTRSTGSTSRPAGRDPGRRRAERRRQEHADQDPRRREAADAGEILPRRRSWRLADAATGWPWCTRSRSSSRT